MYNILLYWPQLQCLSSPSSRHWIYSWTSFWISILWKQYYFWYYGKHHPMMYSYMYNDGPYKLIVLHFLLGIITWSVRGNWVSVWICVLGLLLYIHLFVAVAIIIFLIYLINQGSFFWMGCLYKSLYKVEYTESGLHVKENSEN